MEKTCERCLEEDKQGHKCNLGYREELVLKFDRNAKGKDRKQNRKTAESKGNKFYCKCGKAAIRLNDLKAHALRKCDPENHIGHACPWKRCPYFFLTTQSLATHLSDHHIALDPSTTKFTLFKKESQLQSLLQQTHTDDRDELIK